MKIRNGFVSNSSSSSFVIAYRFGEECPHCGRADLNVVELIKDSYSESCVDALGYDEVIDYLTNNDFKYDYDFEDKDKCFEAGRQDAIKLLHEYTDSNYEFACISIDYNDETLENLIKNNKNIIILKGD